MPLSARLLGNATWGGGLISFTVYQVEITYNNSEKWNIYRRYSEFFAFNIQLINEVGPERYQAMGLKLPEKQFGSSFSSVIKKRTWILQEYLNKLCALDEIQSLACVNNFFDMTNKGVSGMQIELGAQKIVRQLFMSVKYSKNPSLEFWKQYFVVVTKLGTIYVLRSVYHGSPHALHKISLTSQNVRVKQWSNMVIDVILNNSDHLLLKFTNNDEYGIWMRTLSDFLSTPDRIDASNSRPTSTNSTPTSNRAQSGRVTTPIVPETSKDKPDELSAMYGI